MKYLLNILKTPLSSITIILQIAAFILNLF